MWSSSTQAPPDLPGECGAGSGRNRGASEASGSIILFTDDDCVPATGWLDAMLKPLTIPKWLEQRESTHTAKKSDRSFVQIEYEDRYR